MINITICDDELAQTEYLCALVRRWADSVGVYARVLSFDSAESFLSSCDGDSTADILGHSDEGTGRRGARP